VAAGVTILKLQFSAAVLEDLVPFTITRTVGMVAIATDADFITNQDMFGALGAKVVDERARVAGGGSLARPLTEIVDDGWYLHQALLGFTESVVTANADFMSSLTFPFDSRAQRKVSDGEAIVFSIQNGGTDAFQAAIIMRFLAKLH